MRKLGLAVILPLLIGQPALADGLYYGAGAGFYSSQSEEDPGNGDFSKDTYGALGATVGYRWDQPGSFFAVEADADIAFGSDFEFSGVPCSTEAFGPYYCTHQATVRLRGVYGAPLGGFDAYGAAGLVVVTGESAVDDTVVDRAVNTGFTIGAGLQQDLGGNTIRYEVNYDVADNAVVNGDGYEPTFDSLMVKVSLIFQ